MTKCNMAIPQMWTIAQAAQETNTTYTYIRSLVKSNQIKYVKAGRKYLINAQSLCDYFGCKDDKEGDR